MNITPTNLLIIAIVCVVIGYIAGVLISNLRTAKSGPADQSEESETAAPSDGLIEVARLVREDARGPLQIKIAEKHYRLASEMNRREKDAMEETTVELLNWLGYSPNANQSQPQVEPTEPPVAAMAQAAPETGTAAGAENVSFPSAPAVRQTGPLGVRQTGPLGARQTGPLGVRQTGPLGVRQTGPLPPLPAVPAPVKEAPKSIVGQINDILQEKVEGTSFEYRRIRLVESPTGVMVQVGPDKYADINAVPDEEIRSLIRAAAAEWEKRAGK